MADPVEDHRFPCTECGADLRFSPSEEMLVCDHCGNTEPVLATHNATQPIAELDFRRAIEARLPATELQTLRVSRCPNCGAEIEFDPQVHATECPFCATPVVVDTGEQRSIKPSGLVPFAMTEPEARVQMGRWLGRLWFAPSGLVDYARKGRLLQGVYVPFWTFDAATASNYQGQRGTVYYENQSVRVRDRRGGTRNETRRVAKVRWQRVRGRVSRFFDDVLVLAARSLPRSYTDGLAPWDLSRLEPYRPEFLAGFRAEAYTVALEEGMTLAREQMDRMIERDVKFDIGGDRQQIERIETRISDVTFKHILLPVWTAAYRYRGKSYRFVVNGQTGKVQGERPWSAIKIVFAAVVVAILAAAIAYVAQQF